MSKLTRRQLFAGASVFVLAACDGGLPGVITKAVTIGPQLVADVQGIADRLGEYFPSLKDKIPADVWATVNGLLPKLSQLASSLNTSLTETAGKDVVSQVVGVVQQIGSVAGPLLPPPWGLGIQAALALIPIIQGAVGLLVTHAPGAGGMSPATARQVLRIKVVA